MTHKIRLSWSIILRNFNGSFTEEKWINLSLSLFRNVYEQPRDTRYSHQSPKTFITQFERVTAIILPNSQHFAWNRKTLFWCRKSSREMRLFWWKREIHLKDFSSFSFISRFSLLLSIVKLFTIFFIFLIYDAKWNHKKIIFHVTKN